MGLRCAGGLIAGRVVGCLGIRLEHSAPPFGDEVDSAVRALELGAVVLDNELPDLLSSRSRPSADDLAHLPLLPLTRVSLTL